MQNWHTEIFNYFDQRITNAYTESINNLIKGTNRMGRGYSFDVLRARLLYNEAARKATTLRTSVRRRAPDSTADDYMIFKRMMTWSPTDKVCEKAAEYGPSLSVLARLLEEGHFL